MLINTYEEEENENWYDPETEEWAIIKDHPHYEISNQGRVRRRIY